MSDPGSDSAPTPEQVVRKLQDDLARLGVESASADADDDTTEIPRLSGTGEALDGKVRVTVVAGHVSDVTLDPRVLRVSSEELGEAIRDATNAAIDAQTTQFLAGVPPTANLEELTRMLDELSAESLRAIEASGQGIRDALEAIKRLRD
ncbi:MAG TPA: YbaB/EbfC family nucleoid-associated protein [Actinopolymorphaceae bacterium]